MFRMLEGAGAGAERGLTEILDSLAFNEHGLIPAIAQSVSTNEVLMLAWMNREAIDKTLTDGFAWYWSRSRQSFWKKGWLLFL